MLHRFHQGLLIVSTLCLSWLGMIALHEFGHVVYAGLSGGQLTRVRLHPLKFHCPRQLANSRPLVTWGGVIWGSALPLVLLWLVRATFPSQAYLGQFFAGFCLAGNGAYLVIGVSISAGDAGELMRFGVPSWLLVLFGFPAIVAGLGLWHGLGPKFGLGAAGGQVDRRAAWGVAAVAAAIAVAELLVAH